LTTGIIPCTHAAGFKVSLRWTPQIIGNMLNVLVVTYPYQQEVGQAVVGTTQNLPTFPIDGPVPESFLYTINAYKCTYTEGLETLTGGTVRLYFCDQLCDHNLQFYLWEEVIEGDYEYPYGGYGVVSMNVNLSRFPLQRQMSEHVVLVGD
jgi:hypothetical protein